MSKANGAVAWAVAIANNPAHGYDQTSRWGPDYDCSSLVIAAWESGKIRINSPNFTIRGQANILDQPYWEALTDIRYQYVIELWKAPLESFQYDGWQNQQSVGLSLNCLYSASHTLI